MTGLHPEVQDADGKAPSHLKALLRLGVDRLRAKTSTSAPSPAPKRRLAAERRSIPIDPRRSARFTEVTDGARIAALRGEQALLPPTFPALWETALAIELLGGMDGPLPIAGLIHRESERVCVRPLRVADRVRCRLELDRVEPHPRGTQLTLAGRCWNAAGQLCTESTMVLLARTAVSEARRAAGSAERSTAAAESTEVAGPQGEWEELARWEIEAGRGRRYARVSGDYNPIHLWSWTARWFGFERPILHGFCIEAMVAHALIERRLGGEPAALRRLRLRFRAPLLLPTTARLLVRAEDGRGEVRVTASEGKTVVDGQFVGGT